MAIRVRKLAKELKQTSGEVLGMLHYLGFSHYQRPDDMVADVPADKVRVAVKKGVVAQAVYVDEPAPKKQVAPASNSVMAQLVPGVVPVGGAVAPRGVTPVAATPVAATPVAATPVAATAMAAEPTSSNMEIERQRWKAECAALRLECDALTAQVMALRSSPPSRDEPPVGIDVGDLLKDRGLVGPDEGRGALAALLSARQADALLTARISQTGAERLRRDLASLVLLEGSPPMELTSVAVAVGADRAEGPGAEQLDRFLAPLGEQLLLNGMRRLRFVGVPPRWHGALTARIDSRISVDYSPGGEWDGPRAAIAMADVDVVGATSVDVLPAALSVIEASSVLVVVDTTGLLGLLQALVQRLRD